MEINKLYPEDCFITMENMVKDNVKIDVVITSPPYCTPYDSASKNYTEKKFENYMSFYDVFEGFTDENEYRDWTVKLFNAYDTVLQENGVILYNLSYTVNNPDLVYLCLADIINKTNFTVVDCISWKKNNALPQNRNANRLTRVCEFVFVICRKTETKTFRTNKEVYVKDTANKFYKNLSFNYIEAPNNDILDTKINKLNNATFSTAFVMALLNMYVKKEYIVYDSFIGLGTTAVACKQFGCKWIGSELSEKQVEFANKRLSGINVVKNNKVARLF